MTNPMDAPKTAPLAWARTLQVGEIVAFEFPHEREGADAPNCRPSLVLDLQEFGGTLFAELAYGTTRPKPSRAKYGVAVERRAELVTASLHQPTTFDTARRVKVALTHPGFDVHPEMGTPVLGRLGRARARLEHMRARLRAERDGRRRPSFGRARPRTVTVERRARGKRTVREMRHV